MPAVKTEKTMNVSMDCLKKAIVDFEAYPEFLPEVVGSKLIESGDKPIVEFELSVFKRFCYKLRFDLSTPDIVSWSLLESDFFKKNEGRWILTKESAKKTKVVYELDVEVGFFIPGMISRKLTEVSFPKTLASFEARAKELEEA